MDIWTVLTIISIPPTVAYYGVKWHRTRLAKRRAEIVRRVQSIPLERAVYRLRENVRQPTLQGYVSPGPSAGDVASGQDLTPAQIEELRANIPNQG